MSSILGQSRTETESRHKIRMRLQRPTDFLILEAYSDGENYHAPTITHKINKSVDSSDEKKRPHINQRLPQLEDYGLLEKLPPDRSGLYHITEKGLSALKHRDEYGNSDFEELVERDLRKRKGTDA